MAEADETLLWQWGACADVSVFVLLNLKIILVYTGHSTIIDGTVLLNLADRKDPGSWTTTHQCIALCADHEATHCFPAGSVV